ncbi:hypothetical protein DM01DRAFT_1381566 [Hesseltinella vesiculosa]|uniref:Uncharacterized protein n=1 Tax=Hesseltinella vesiculosa TaxID=101127 RepID=A0A1X2GRN2_9FUNG|nr:hypothetical protein DM01DRAFT_1381566 [Hesseltinella vesiculosa]
MTTAHSHHVLRLPEKSIHQLNNNTLQRPHRIRVLGIAEEGAKSRVETQMRLCLELVDHDNEKVVDWSHLHIPEPLLTQKRRHATTATLASSQANQKSRLTSPPPAETSLDPPDPAKVLTLSASIICETDPKRKVTMCHRCVVREWKRADRKKAGRKMMDSFMYDGSLMEKERKRILIFNSEPILAFDHGECILPTRITCYSRHHDERQGFRIKFALHDRDGALVAAGQSPPVMITDDHKNLSKLTDKQRRRRKPSNHRKPKPSAAPAPLLTPKEEPVICFDDICTLGPNLLDPYLTLNSSPLSTSLLAWPHSSPTTSPPVEQYSSFSSSSSSPSHADSDLYSPVSSPSSPQPQHLLLAKHLSAFNSSPRMDRLVPHHGGPGSEITVLGSDFYDGLTCYFGNQPAVTTYWNPTTLVCTVPAQPQPQQGPLPVSFHDPSFVAPLSTDLPISFTYTSSVSTSATTPLSSTVTSPLPTAYPADLTLPSAYLEWTEQNIQMLTCQVLNLSMAPNVQEARQIALRLMELQQHQD